MWTVYILQSVKFGRYYVGHTKVMSARLKQHNAGKVRSTKAFLPWRIVYTQPATSKHVAYSRELQIKSYKGGQAFRELISPPVS